MGMFDATTWTITTTNVMMGRLMNTMELLRTRRAYRLALARAFLATRSPPVGDG